jgi:acyl carrier protein
MQRSHWSASNSGYLSDDEGARVEKREAVAVDDAVSLITSFTAEALAIPAVSADSNLLELGVDSLVAARIVAGLRAKLRINIPLITLFQNPYVPDFALEIVALYEESVDEMVDQSITWYNKEKPGCATSSKP